MGSVLSRIHELGIKVRHISSKCIFLCLLTGRFKSRIIRNSGNWNQNSDFEERPSANIWKVFAMGIYRIPTRTKFLPMGMGGHRNQKKLEFPT
jgi:hypothetical protein